MNDGLDHSSGLRTVLSFLLMLVLVLMITVLAILLLPELWPGAGPQLSPSPSSIGS